MKNLLLEATEDSPKILLNGETGEMNFIGRSFMQDICPYKEAIVEWLRNYFKNPSKVTTVNFQLEYINSNSYQLIASVLAELNKIYIFGKEVIVRWSYHEQDEIIYEQGMEFSEMVAIPFEFKIVTESQYYS